MSLSALIEICHINRVQVVLGTLGNILGMIQRKDLHTESVQMLIIDYADELMDESLDDHNDYIVHIHGSLPPNVQVVVKGVNLANCSILDRIFKSEPIRIIGGSTDQVLTLEGTDHYFASIETAEQKVDTLFNLDAMSRRAIVYCNYEVRADEILLMMRERGVAASDKLIRDFLSGEFRFLITIDVRDVWGRGLNNVDIYQSLVINFDFPSSVEHYRSRTGTSGVMGRRGVAISFIGRNDDLHLMKDLEDLDSVNIQVFPDISNITEIFSSYY
eukprot:gene21804-28221_t